MDFSTLCIHSGYKPDCTGSVSAPIYTSTAYAHPGVQQSTGYDYIRTQNPTRESVERCLAALEGGTNGFAFASGMAALACLLELFQPDGSGYRRSGGCGKSVQACHKSHIY